MKKAALWMLLACFAAPMAMADDEPAPPSITAGGLYEFPDNDLDSHNGHGGFLGVRLPVADRPGESAEFEFDGLTRDRRHSGSDSQYALFANYAKDFGLYGWDQDDGVEQYLPSFSPYAVVGVGAILDQIGSDTHYAPALDAGGGLAFPLPWRGIALRTGVHLIADFNDHSVSGDHVLFGWQLRVGLTIPLGSVAPEREHDVTPVGECGVAVVDVVTGRSDCSVDSDRDGVADNADLCPGTPAGTPVDLNGCPPTPTYDADGDGVPDAADDCPGTGPGVTVDINGCPSANPVPAPGQSQTPTLVLSTVRFAKNSADLTAEAKTLLDQAAAQLAGQSDLVVEVAGHTDGEGAANYNLMLSLLRADKVRAYLVAKGVSRYRLFVEGYGETQPVAPNNTAAGRAKNRRVDLDKLDVQVIEH